MFEEVGSVLGRLHVQCGELLKVYTLRHLNENLKFQESSWGCISEESSQREIQVYES